MLSRRIIILKTNEGCILPYDYYYELSKIIYKKITLANMEYGHMLHNEGFRTKDTEQKKMKLFNYSLRFKNKKMQSEGIILDKGDTIELVISGLNKTLSLIIQGLVQDNKISLFNILFEMIDVKENDEKFKGNNINIYKAISPMIESKWDKQIEYLTPFTSQYYDAIKQNLKRKYELIYNKPFNGELKIMNEDVLNVKHKTICIKGGYLHGYAKFNLLLQTSSDMQKVAYYCGLGQNNSIGAGYVQYITGGRSNG